MAGYSKDKDGHLARLRRIEGQVRGLERMIADDVYCIDVLTQISAVTSALNSVALGLLDQHVRHCVAGAARHAQEATDDERAEAEAEADRLVTEATAAIARLVRR